MNPQLSTKLKKVVRWLRKTYPARRPVVVRVVARQDGLHGLCLIDEERALIRLTEQDEQLMIDTLMEEWVHVLRHDTPVTVEAEHDAIFWAILGTVTMSFRGGE